MKIAALSDIHSNVYALQAVISDAGKRSIDVMLNLGDMLYGPIAPRATYDLLMQHEFVTIRGNQDRQIYEAAPEEVETNDTLQFLLEDLGPEPLDWMRSLPFDCQLSEDIYLCHGTPTSDLGYLLEDVRRGYARVRPDSEISRLLDVNESEMILCGHTHTARTIELRTGQIVVNPGSVGLPAYTDHEPVLHSMESYSSHATYAVIEKTGAGWIVQHIGVPYDQQQAAQRAAQRKRHDWAHFLTTGRGM